MADEEIAGLAVKLAMDDSSFTTGIQSLKRELNVLDSGFKVTESSSATFGKSLDGLKEKASSLGEKIQVQQKIVQQYQEQLSKSKTVLEENSQKMLDMKDKVDILKSAYEEATSVTVQNAESIAKLKGAYEQANVKLTESTEKVKNLKKAYEQAREDENISAEAVKELKSTYDAATKEEEQNEKIVKTLKSTYEQATEGEKLNAESTKELEAEYKSLDKEYKSQEQLVARNSKSVDGYTINTNKQQAALNTMKNELTATNKEIETQSSKWISAGNQLTTLSKSTKTVGESLTNVGESMSTKVTLPVVAGLTAATVSASTFEHQMADISKEVASKGENVNSVMGQMSSSSLKWSEDFGQSTTSINEGLLTLVKDGYTGSEAMNIMGTSLNTARGADEDLATVVDQLGSSLEAYGMKTNDAATTTANMSHMADTFAYVANHTKASISGLGEAFSIVGPLASQLKIPMAQTAAAIGELESNGIDASTAATALQAGLVNLTKPTAKMQAALKEMNFSAFDSTGKMKDLTTIIAEMSQKTAGWTDKQREAAYATIFGKESLASWGVLMHKGSDYLENLSTNANNATGEVKKLSDSMKNTPQNNLKELEESVHALGVAFGEDVLPTLIPIVKETTEMVKGFANLDDGTKKMIITIAGVTAVVGPTLVVIGKVATGISAIEGVIGKVSGAIGKKVVANATDTASTVANTAATNINTAAQEANTKAREANATSEGANTAAKDASTVAEAENTAATVANEAAQGKNAVSAVNTAEKMTKLGGEAGTAGKALLGAGTAAGTAGEAIAGAGTAAASAGEATTGMGVAATGASVSFGVVAAAAAGVSLAGYGIYKAYKMVTDQTVPQVDLFANSVVSTATKVKAQNGTVATQMKDTTVSISNSTKQAVSAYLDMDKKVSKSMQDIYVNSNNFSKQEKNSVISAYTDMANKVTSLTGSNKTAVLNNFKQMVSNTTTLTSQSRSQIVAQYTQMVNQVSGLTAQQKQKTIKDFSDSLKQASGITQSQAAGIINQFKQMGNKINSAINDTDQKQIKSVQDLFSKTTTITNAEQADILQSMQKHDTSKKAEANLYVQQISDIYTNAANNHRNLTQTEENTVNDIRTRMQTLAVQSLSKNETDTKVILQRMKDYNGQMTLAQASDTIQNAEKAHKGAVDAANKQYNDTLATIIQMRDGTHTITTDQANKMIAEAKRQRDQSVKEADGQKKEVVDKVKQMNSSVVSELDTGTGKQLSTWQKLERGIGGIINSISSKWNSTMSSIFGSHEINVTTTNTGQYGGGAVGRTRYTLNAEGGIFNQATRVTLGGNPYNIVGEGKDSEAVIPLSDSVLAGIGEGILKAVKKRNTELSVQLPDNTEQSIKYGENMMLSIVNGIKDKKNLLSDASKNISTELNNNSVKAVAGYVDVLKSEFTSQLNNQGSFISNTAIKFSDTLKKATERKQQFSDKIVNEIGHNQTTDSALTELNHDMEGLSVSTNNAQDDMRNMLGQMVDLSAAIKVSDDAYLKLGNSIGWSDSKTQDYLSKVNDYEKKYEELGQKILEAQQKLRANEFDEAYEKIDAKVKELSEDTGNNIDNLNNQQETLTLLKQKGGELNQQYQELLTTYGQYSDEVKSAQKNIDDNNQSIDDMNQKIKDTQEELQASWYDTKYEEIDAKVKSLSGDTDDLNVKLTNQNETMQYLKWKAQGLDEQYRELTATYGEFSDEAKNAKKAIDDNSQSMQNLGKNIEDTKQKMQETSETTINTVADKVKEALKDYYTDMDKQEEDYWKKQIDNNNTWKETTLKNLETVYNNKKSELEKEKTLLDRNDSDQDSQDKIAEDNKILSMNYSAKKKAEAEKDKNDTLKEMNRRHQKEQLEDQETALEAQYNKNKDSIETIAKANEDSYNAQIDTVKAFYEEKEKDSQLDAETEKLMMSNNQKEVITLLKSYGKDYELAGGSIGERFAKGFKDQIGSIQDAFDGVSGYIDRLQAKMAKLTTSTVSLTTVDGSNPYANGSSIGIVDTAIKNINSIVSQINTASLSVPSTALASSSAYNTNSYHTSYNSTYDSLFHADNITLNNAQDMQNLMEEIQRLADIERMAKGVK